MKVGDAERRVTSRAVVSEPGARLRAAFHRHDPLPHTLDAHRVAIATADSVTSHGSLPDWFRTEQARHIEGHLADNRGIAIALCRQRYKI